MMMFLIRARDWLVVALGFRRVGKINTEPPQHLWEEIEPGVWRKPRGLMVMEVVIMHSLRSRLLLLLSGKLQVVVVAWADEPVPHLRWDVWSRAVLPPYDKVPPERRV